MVKWPKSLLLQLTNINIRNNWAHPPKEFLMSLGVTFHEFIFFKWKKHREFQSIHSKVCASKNVKSNKKPEWGGGVEGEDNAISI